MVRKLLAAGIFSLLSSCAVYHLTAYSMFPDYPEPAEFGNAGFQGLTAPVDVTVLDDGRYKIEAKTSNDLYFVEGYLQARDRMFQMDLFRHLALGRLAELVGNVPFGEGTALDTDRFNRFMGFAADAEHVLKNISPEELGHAESFAAGVNHWLATGERSIEHRLLGAEVAPWQPRDSIAIFRMIMFGMTHNHSREVRRLVLACEAGIDGMERIWPTRMEFGPTFLPAENLRDETYENPPAVADELHDALPELCPKEAPPMQTAAAKIDPVIWMLANEIYNPLSALQDGISASNNWVVAGSKTRSGKPILENDPHLPHLNPPIVWGVHQVLPDHQVVGFTLPGVHLVVFGHNFNVSWGITINTVDLQDLYIEQPAPNGTGYIYEGETRPFELRKETFYVRDGEPVEVGVRFSQHGPLLNDLDRFLKDRIPLTALRGIDLRDAGDATAVLRANFAKNATEFVDAIQGIDSACLSWVYADTSGNIGFTSPCKVPLRKANFGTFPVPGWLAKYEWAGYVPKSELPQSMNPASGYIATANNQSVPFNRFPTALNNDPNPPNRFVRIDAYLKESTDLTIDDMAAFALDTGVSHWPKVRESLYTSLCRNFDGDMVRNEAVKEFCGWDGMMASGSVGATLFILTTNAMLDRALADELQGGAEGATWRYLQSIPHFEALVDWTWQRDATDAVWDDVRTPARETRAEIVKAAFDDAVKLAAKRYGNDVAAWQWGTVRPFYIKHPFGSKGGVVASLFNGEQLPGIGGPETVFKNQFSRVDRESMHPGAGPIIRLVTDMADPNGAVFAFAGGESGWAKSPHYGNLTADWMDGKMRPLTPSEEGTKIRFIPGK